MLPPAPEALPLSDGVPLGVTLLVPVDDSLSVDDGVGDWVIDEVGEGVTAALALGVTELVGVGDGVPLHEPVSADDAVGCAEATPLALFIGDSEKGGVAVAAMDGAAGAVAAPLIVGLNEATLLLLAVAHSDTDAEADAVDEATAVDDGVKHALPERVTLGERVREPLPVTRGDVDAAREAETRALGVTAATEGDADSDDGQRTGSVTVKAKFEIVCVHAAPPVALVKPRMLDSLASVSARFTFKRCCHCVPVLCVVLTSTAQPHASYAMFTATHVGVLPSE